jgi:uncharacterized protein YndB with AHSA1/START domain
MIQIWRDKMRKGDEPIVIEQSFNSAVEKVWNAITDVNQMRQWYFENIPSFKPEVGFKTQFEVKGQSRSFLHMWEVTEVIPEKKIAYNWKYDGLQGDSAVVFELFDQNNLTTLTVTHHILESFPEEIPEFARESGVAGWTFFIGKNLKQYLEKID